jgi:hypothetical protein
MLRLSETSGVDNQAAPHLADKRQVSVTDKQDVGRQVGNFVLPTWRILKAIRKQGVGWCSVAKKKPEAINRPFTRERKSCKVSFVVRRKQSLCVAERGFGHGTERRRTLGILSFAHCVVVITANNQGSFLANPSDELAWIGAVIHKVTEHPELVIIFGKGRQGLNVCMQVGENGDFHRIK